MEQKNKDIFEQTTKFNTGIKLYMFQTGTIKTKIKFIKQSQTNNISFFTFNIINKKQF